jgi:hypothetical protein
MRGRYWRLLARSSVRRLTFAIASAWLLRDGRTSTAAQRAARARLVQGSLVRGRRLLCRLGPPRLSLRPRIASAPRSSYAKRSRQRRMFVRCNNPRPPSSSAHRRACRRQCRGDRYRVCAHACSWVVRWTADFRLVRARLGPLTHVVKRTTCFIRLAPGGVTRGRSGTRAMPKDPWKGRHGLGAIKLA